MLLTIYEVHLGSFGTGLVMGFGSSAAGCKAMVYVVAMTDRGFEPEAPQPPGGSLGVGGKTRVIAPCWAVPRRMDIMAVRLKESRVTGSNDRYLARIQMHVRAHL